MSKIDRYLDSLLRLPIWIGFPIFYMSIAVPLLLAILTIYAMVVIVSPWLLLSPVAIWSVCAINWWLKNKDK